MSEGREPLATLSLESLSYLIEEKGKEWNKFKQTAERLDELRKILLAEIQNKEELIAITGGAPKAPSETKLERLARGSAEFKAHAESVVVAKKEANDTFMEYEALKNLFDAKRSEMALERARASLV